MRLHNQDYVEEERIMRDTPVSAPHTATDGEGERVIETIKCMRSLHTSYRWRGESHRANQVYALTTHSYRWRGERVIETIKCYGSHTHQLQVERSERHRDNQVYALPPHTSYRWREEERVLETITCYALTHTSYRRRGGEERHRANQFCMRSPPHQLQVEEEREDIEDNQVYALTTHQLQGRRERDIEPIKCMRSPHTSYRWSGRSVLVARVNEINYSINHRMIHLIWSDTQKLTAVWKRRHVKKETAFMILSLRPFPDSDRQMINHVNRCRTSNWIRQKGGGKTREGRETHSSFCPERSERSVLGVNMSFALVDKTVYSVNKSKATERKLLTWAKPTNKEINQNRSQQVHEWRNQKNFLNPRNFIESSLRPDLLVVNEPRKCA